MEIEIYACLLCGIYNTIITLNPTQTPDTISNPYNVATAYSTPLSTMDDTEPSSSAAPSYTSLATSNCLIRGSRNHQ